MTQGGVSTEFVTVAEYFVVICSDFSKFIFDGIFEALLFCF